MKKSFLIFLILMMAGSAGAQIPFSLTVRRLFAKCNSAHFDTTGGTLGVIMADSAGKALQDASGNTITTTYLAKADTANELRSTRPDTSTYPYKLGKIVTSGIYEGTALGDTGTATKKCITIGALADTLTAKGYVSTTENLTVNADLSVGGEIFQFNHGFQIDTSYIWAQQGPELVIGATRIVDGGSPSPAYTDTTQSVHPTWVIAPKGAGPNLATAVSGWNVGMTGQNGGSNYVDTTYTYKWKYVLVSTPLPTSYTDGAENPYLRVSNDLIHWTRPHIHDNWGDSIFCPDPIVRVSDFTGATHLSDPCLFTDKTGAIWLAIRVTYASYDRIYIIPLLDLIGCGSGSMTQIIQTTGSTQPSIILDKDGKYTCWFDGSDSTTSHYWRSDTLASSTAWHDMGHYTLHGLGGHPLAHRSVRRWGNQYHMFINDATNNTGGEMFFVSDDGKDWYGTGKCFLTDRGLMGYDRYSGTAGDTGGVSIYGMGNDWDTTHLYLGTANWIEDGNGGYYHFIYSAQGYGLPASAYKWGVGYCRIHFGKKPVTISNIKWFGHPPDDSVYFFDGYWIGTTGYEWVDSSATTANQDDTVRGYFTISQDCYLDSAVVKCIGYGDTDTYIDSTLLWGPGRSAGDNNTDSLYWKSTDDLGKRTIAVRTAFELGHHRVFAGDRFSLAFGIHFTDVNDVIRIYYVKLWGRPR